MAESSRGSFVSTHYNGTLFHPLQSPSEDSPPAVPSSSDNINQRRFSADGDCFADPQVYPPPLKQVVSPLDNTQVDGDYPVMGLLFSRAGLGGLRSPSSTSSTFSSPGETDVGEGSTSAGVIGLSFTTGYPDERPEYAAPIVGYEVMEERARFTVFKIKVEHHLTARHWYVFRRYTDFLRLNRKLKALFPGLRFALPPKRWFGDNFDLLFLEDRLIGLQAFVNNLMAHKEISKSFPVRDFFCLDDPPGPEDGIDESRALCESLEDKVNYMEHLMSEKDKEMELLKAEVSMLRSQQQALLKSLKMQCSISSLALSRLSCAYSKNAPPICARSGGTDTKQTSSSIPFGHLLQVHCFNLAFGEIIERTISSLSDSRSATRATLDKVLEESSICDDAQVPNSSSSEMQVSTSPKFFSLEDFSSRSTGDGSTGSQERLPPVGDSMDNPYINEVQRVNNEMDIPVDSVTFKTMLAKDLSNDSSTPKKCAIIAMTPNKVTTIELGTT